MIIKKVSHHETFESVQPPDSGGDARSPRLQIALNGLSLEYGSVLYSNELACQPKHYIIMQYCNIHTNHCFALVLGKISCLLPFPHLF